MGIILEQREESNLICLEGALDIASAAELKCVLLDALQSGRAVSVSLDRCTGMDVTAVQLLWAAQREARASSVVFALTGKMPEQIIANLKDAGIEAFPVTA